MGLHKGPWKDRERAPGGEPPYDDDVNARVSALEARLDTILPTLATKADMAGLRADLAESKTEFHRGFADVVKWIVGAGFTAVAVVISAMTYLQKTVTAPAASTQPPIIINVPGAAAPAAASPASRPR